MQYPHLLLLHFGNHEVGYRSRRGSEGFLETLSGWGVAMHSNGQAPRQAPKGTTSPRCPCPASPGASPCAARVPGPHSSPLQQGWSAAPHSPALASCGAPAEPPMSHGLRSWPSPAAACPCPSPRGGA